MNKKNEISYKKDISNNYYLEFIKEYKEIRKKEEGKPKLLLHVCCAPCSAYPLVFLQDLFEITILYTNSNIFPKEEYDKRLYNLKRYVNELNNKFNKHISLIEDLYDYESFKKDLVYYKNQKEGLNRCKICIAKRIDRLFLIAKEKGFKYVTTVMSISRNKDADYINLIGKKIEEKYNKEIRFIYSDFKKNDGQEIGIKISKKYNLYRQDYCGCEYSLLNKNNNNHNHNYSNNDDDNSNITNLNDSSLKIIKNYEVSFILTINKESKILRKCLDSLINQRSNIPYEILIYIINSNKNSSNDDNNDFNYSNNRSANLDSINHIKEIINEYREKNPELIFLNDKIFDSFSEARNDALKNSKGRYLSFLGLNGYIDEFYLAKNYKKALKNNSDIVVSNYKIIKNIDKIPSKYNFRFYRIKKYNQNKNNIVLKALFNDIFIRGYLEIKFFKKDFLKNQNLFFMSENILVEDVFFTFLTFIYAKKITFISDTLFYQFKNYNKDDFDINTFPQRIINSWFLSRYALIKEGKQNIGQYSFLAKLIMLTFNYLKFYKKLETPLLLNLKSVRKQLKKLLKNEYIYEGEEWEKALYLYLEKSKDNHY